ncbi:DNA mismatch repair endonuclease MutL [Companilactobacillus bobalius]|uniref:DNA mismatch repair protein MutL n=2 Tax=Companilactobacillus bobalius TaxID=2801451 RepID=A0A202FEI4_9LACO|nr:DNA mismatch repair endonuclease MutL [Companilactobacillus bobalius]KAE9557180.1 DNA mismatch repair protein MutL [Companilactobacillus bobalius]KRK82110.1 DNA mismatch repair protein [Companilactobacillus bobalius DSM 19674]OVE98848.1 DNA mismatch repair protein MutL [Companilactobacillus bobalius]GEO58022.1 DNA mismatch repair protein MutL [Companilactobacillus paralimentarius]
MGIIHELPVELSNQIAAGEVIERPASVVKELVENSIDAQATQVLITIQQAGLKLIEVNDNGKGISSDDVEVAFLPHTTSKISNDRDLFNIRTLGFRGEALASIASISKLTVLTSMDGKSAVRAKYSGNELVKKETFARSKGTTITVEDMFFNTPARLKYVKSLHTELNKIVDIVDRLAMGHPDISFRLINEGKDLVWTSGNDNLQQTIAGIYGRTIASHMLEFENSDPDYEIHGFFSKPDTTRSNRSYISLILNGRYIRNFQLTNAVIRGYGSKLMVARFPVAVIDIKMDPSLVDINVHPTKQEVRLSNEGHIGDLISDGIKRRLSDQNLIPDAVKNLGRKEPVKTVDTYKPEQISFSDIATIAKISEPLSTPTKTIEPENPMPNEQPQPMETSETFETPMTGMPIFKDPDHLKLWDQRLQKETESKVKVLNSEPQAADTKDSEPINQEEKSGFPDLRYIGQIHGTYLVAESEDGFYLIDQHAAQERVNYEYYRKEIGKVSNDQQKLLVPIVLDYPNSESILIREKKPVLESIGLYLDDFGQNSFVVNTHPTWFVPGQEESTIKEMVDYVLNDSKISVASFREKNAIMMSCKRAIKANHHIDDREAVQLLHNLTKAENPYNCPHGRPVLVEFSNKDLEKMFKRIQDPHDTRESE